MPQYVRSCASAILSQVATAVVILAIALVASPAHATQKRQPKVLVVHSSSFAEQSADVQQKLGSAGVFGAVDLFNATIQTPTLAQLHDYDAVLVFSSGGDAAFQDPAALGNALADYVDAGGGVVTMPDAQSTITGNAPTGRWNPGYLSLPAPRSVVLASFPKSIDIASITDQNHPVLTGVGIFSIGTGGERNSATSVVAGATILAKYTDGIVLASAGPLPGRADLNFSPVSSSLGSRYWAITTDGLKLMVNALLYTIRPRVAIVQNAPEGAYTAADGIAKMRTTGLLGIIDVIDITYGVPTLQQLSGYDGLLLALMGPKPPVAFGNVLADYVDAGGGVVVTAASFYPQYAIPGRWSPDYELVQPGNPSETMTLGTVVYPAHPIVAGVTSLTNNNYGMRFTALRPGAFTIAQSSNGSPLAAGSTRLPNRIDLCMSIFSTSVASGGWDASSDGGKLLANALLTVCKPYIGCVAADYTASSNDVRNKIVALRRFSGVTVVNAAGAPPSGSTLQPFGAILTYSNLAYGSPVTLGDRMADYVDAGGGVVLGAFANIDTGDSTSLLGRWVSGGYHLAPGPLPGLLTGNGTLGVLLEPNHPVNRFVRKFDGGSRSWRQLFVDIPLRGREILRWNDSRMLASVHNFRKRVDLGFVPFSEGVDANAWKQRTDGAWLMANALEYAVYHKPCPGDFNGDGQVDDSDFVLFAAHYDELVDPRGDLNGDGNTDDSDFVVFAASYDTLLCP